MTTDAGLPDNGEDDLLPGEPTLHETMEFAMAVSLDIENSLDQEENPFESVIQITINAGQLLYLAYTALDMYQALEDLDDEAMDMLEEYVKAKKRTPNNSNLMH